MNINKHYIVFIWIILLIIFTFYCIFRIKYIREKYMDVMTKKKSVAVITQQSFISSDSSDSSSQLPIITQLPIMTKSSLSKDYKDPNDPNDPKDPKDLQQIPTTTQSQDVISYINNVQKYKDIIDIPGCENIYDDNYSVRDLGYNNCGNAYADYLEKNLDVNNTYGKTKSLGDICPASSKTPKYNKCLEKLLTKFTENNAILDNVNTDMSRSINKRINDRSAVLSSNEIDTKLFIYDKNQVDFNNDMLKNGHVANYPDERLTLINSYYQDKYKGGIEKFTNLVETDIEDNFFGTFKSVNGQYIAFTDLKFTLGYSELANTAKRNASDVSNSSNRANRANRLGITPTTTYSSAISSSSSSSPTQLSNSSSPTQLSNSSSPTKLSNSSSPTQLTNSSSPTQLSDSSSPTQLSDSSSPTQLSDSSSSSTPSQTLTSSLPINTKKVKFTISNNDLNITYDVVNIDFYKKSNKALKIILTNKTILFQKNNNNTTEQLLSILGLNDTSQLIFVSTSFVSSEGKTHTTYKLVNDNLDTIIVLNKI
jgi:hypothetical protein